MPVGKPSGRKSPRGFTYLWLLAAMALLGCAMAAAGPWWAQRTQREREAELLRVGVLYARAIEHYHALSPGGSGALPHEIGDLLLDPRFSTPVRHLRDAYPDPIDPTRALEPVFNDRHELTGLRSASPLAPLRRVEWSDGAHVIGPATSYQDWRFMARVPP